MGHGRHPPRPHRLHASEPGTKGVEVGIIDTGIDGSHPDVAPTFDAALSRSFTTDVPATDGLCEVATCKDPANVDDDGHGTHVASTVGSPPNGVGTAGVAPGVTLVNLRAGQDSGFFLQPTLDAIACAGRSGVDVVNTSFYVDPWLLSCSADPADSPAEQAGVVTVNATGPSGRRAYCSSYGTEQSDVSAPGGDAYDTPDDRPDPAALVLAAYPEHPAREKQIDAAGKPTDPFVIRDCKGDVCGHHQYLQGTSMASPHAAGVAALVVSRYGKAGPARAGELTLPARSTELGLLGSATDTACPTPRTQTYRFVRASGTTEDTATCDGPADRNGFYGQGLVDALGAVTFLG